MIQRLCSLLAVWLALAVAPATAQEPLPSWRDGPARQAILRFVDTVTTPGSPGFVPPPERIAVFDNDGTLWVEQPAYTQLLFALDRVRALAPQNPDWASREPFRSAIAGDMAGLAAAGERGLLELVMATHAGMTPEAFQATVTAWMETARDPRFGRRFDGLVYQPMLELMAFLRTKGFKTYIVLTSSTTRPASRSGSTGTSAAARSPPSAIPTATLKCCNGRPRGPGPGSA